MREERTKACREQGSGRVEDAAPRHALRPTLPLPPTMLLTTCLLRRASCTTYGPQRTHIVPTSYHPQPPLLSPSHSTHTHAHVPHRQRRTMTHGMDHVQLRAEGEAGAAGVQRLAPGVGIIKESKRSVVASAAAAALAPSSFPRTARREVLRRQVTHVLRRQVIIVLRLPNTGGKSLESMRNTRWRGCATHVLRMLSNDL